MEGTATSDAEPAQGREARRRAAVQLAVVVVPVAALVVGVHLLQGSVVGDIRGRSTASVVAGTIALGSISLLLVGFVLVRWRESLASIGLRRTNPLGAVGWGFVALGVTYAAASALVVAWVAVRVARGTSFEDLTRERLMNMEPLAGVPSLAVVPLALFVAMWEEIVFRGFILSRLRTLLGGDRPGRWRAVALAVVVSSVVFAAGHGYQGAIGLAETFVIGVVFALFATWRGNVWSTIMAHCGIDTVSLLLLPYVEATLNHGAS